LNDAGGLIGARSVDQQRQLIEARLDLCHGARPGHHPDQHDLLPESPVDERGSGCCHDGTTTACNAPRSAGLISTLATRRTAPASSASGANESSPESVTSAVPPGL